MVRAVFDNSSFVIPGEQVKVAGVTVGTIHAVQLTPQNKAAVVLQITNRQVRAVPHRRPLRDRHRVAARRAVRAVHADAAARRPANRRPPPLAAITSGPDQGQHLLPVQNTTTPVGLDLLNDITRLPEQQRLRLIISGLGAGLGGQRAGAQRRAAAR